MLQVGTAVGRDSMAVGVEYHGGLGGIGIENTMVGGVVVYWVVSERARRISTRAYVEKKRRCALVKGLFEILNAGVVPVVKRGGGGQRKVQPPLSAILHCKLRYIFYRLGLLCSG